MSTARAQAAHAVPVGGAWTRRAEIERKQALLATRRARLRVDLKMHENQQSHIEGIFARGDRRLADVLEAAFRAGCRFDGWDDVLASSCWDAGVRRDRGVDGLASIATSARIPVTARLPWDHIDVGLEDGFLVKEYRKALKDRLSPAVRQAVKQLLHPNTSPTPRRPRKSKLVCYDCGVACDLDRMKAERLYYLRRMNAWTAAVVRRPRRPRPAAGAKPRRPAPVTRITQADGVSLPPALHQARPHRLSRPPRSRSATCRASSAAPGSRCSTRSAFTPSPSCRSGRRSGSGSRRWASSST